ncbi:MAG: NAD(P)-binding domain-containing protein, partial [Gemmatimonadetes bacterium]|nr:NAD(P)-binding domain-containing protein [Gemmatimonadota bacterium]
MSAWRRFAEWLHLQWPAGTVEKLPEVREDGSTNVPGLFVAGDLRGVPLLKFSADTGARVAERLADDLSRAGQSPAGADVFDLAIVGAGVAGMSAALTARRRGLRFVVLESSEPFSTIVNFPRAKPIYTYPKDMTPAGELAVTASVKEALVDELRGQTVDQGIVPASARVERVAKAPHGFDVVLAGGDTVRARRVLAALGRSGDFRRLDVPGEDLDKVSNRLHDPRDFQARRVLVVGGGDSALESAIALAENGADVTLSYRRADLARPKAENTERANELAASGKLALRLATEVTEIREQDVVLRHADGRSETIPNDFVFAMIGREAPLEFFRRSGVTIAGDRGAKFWATLLAFAGVIGFLYHWKAGGKLTAKFQAHDWFPFQFMRPEDASTLAGTLGIAFQTPAAWFTLAYTLAIVGFGVRRIRRRRTPYVTVQTLTLMAFQIVPLFLLPSVLLPWAGHRGAFGDADRVVTIAPAAATRWEESVLHSPEDPAALLDSVRPDLPADVAAWPDLSLEVSWPIRHAGDRLLLHGADGRLATVRVSDRRIHVHDPTRGSSWWADQLFPASEWDAQGREYWRTIGLILAWPLFLWNVFTYQPMVLWLVISVVQTFVLIPLLIRFWGKGAYCGWICSCGGL